MKRNKKTKNTLRNVGIAALLLAVIASVFLVFSLGESQVAYTGQCDGGLPSCPSGYTEVDS